MEKWRSPLRYPGGKIKLAPFFKRTIQENPNIKHYIEPFAGGAGIAINLLLNGVVKHITLNDYDVAIFCFWKSLTNYSDNFFELFDKTPITIKEWQKQLEIFKRLEVFNSSELNKEEIVYLGYATFFLNRTNFSGILRGATPIGGLQQSGKWKIDCEFNKERLRPLLMKIAENRTHINVTNFDITTSLLALEHTETTFSPGETFMFIDPPYVEQGKRLYLPINTMDEHLQISKQIKQLESHWVLTYDAVDQLLQYYDFATNRFLYTLQYKIKTHRQAVEFMAISDDLKFSFDDVLTITEKLS